MTKTNYTPAFLYPGEHIPTQTPTFDMSWGDGVILEIFGLKSLKRVLGVRPDPKNHSKLYMAKTNYTPAFLYPQWTHPDPNADFLTCLGVMGVIFEIFWSEIAQKGLRGAPRPKKSLKSGYDQNKLHSCLSVPPENTSRPKRRLFDMSWGDGGDFWNFWSEIAQKGLRGAPRPKKSLKSVYDQNKLHSCLSIPPENTSRPKRRLFDMSWGDGGDFRNFLVWNRSKGS